MTDKDDDARDRREQRIMWIFSGAIVLFILGAMGANVLFHKDTASTTPTDVSAQSRAEPAK